MKCPHCDQSLNVQVCPHCEAELLDSGPYCGYCGRHRSGEQSVGEDSSFSIDSNRSAMSDDAESLDWEQRTLCSDGNCIGVIGPDGRCKECGKPLQDQSSE